MVVLKGGMLMLQWLGSNSQNNHGYGCNSASYPLTEETIREALSEICAIQLDDEVTLVLDHIVPSGRMMNTVVIE